MFTHFPDRAVFCPDCEMYLNGKTQWQRHKIGQKHRLNTTEKAAARLPWQPWLDEEEEVAAEDGEARRQVEAQRVLGVVVDDLAEERRRAVLMLAVAVEARRAWADLDAEANDLHERWQQEVQYRARLVEAMLYSERIAVGRERQRAEEAEAKAARLRVERRWWRRKAAAAAAATTQRAVDAAVASIRRHEVSPERRRADTAEAKARWLRVALEEREAWRGKARKLRAWAGPIVLD